VAPNRQDLNLVDYKTGEKCISNQNISNVSELKQQLIET